MTSETPVAEQAALSPTIEEVALHWARQGYAVVPLVAKAPNRPFGFFDSQPVDVAQLVIAAWALKGDYDGVSQGGLVLDGFAGGGPALTVVDLDNMALEADARASVPPTHLEVSSGREGGGRHLFYQRDPATSTGSHTLLQIGADLKARHGYVVVPGSLHKSGLTYTAFVDGRAVGPLEIDRATFESLPILPESVVQRLLAGDKAERLRRDAEKRKEARASTGLVSTSETAQVHEGTFGMAREPGARVSPQRTPTSTTSWAYHPVASFAFYATLPHGVSVVTPCCPEKGKRGTVYHNDGRTEVFCHRCKIKHLADDQLASPPVAGLKAADLAPEALVDLLVSDDEDITTSTEAVSQEEVDRLEARRLRAEADRRRAQEVEAREQAEDEAHDLKVSKIEEMRAVVDAGDVVDDLERRRRLEAHGGGGLPHAVAQSLEEEDYANSKLDGCLYEQEGVAHTSTHQVTKAHISEEDFSTIDRVVAELDQEERVGCGRGPSVHVASRSRGNIVSSTSSCFAFTCPRCGPRLLRAARASGRLLFADYSTWSVVLLCFKGCLPPSLESALHRWREKSTEDRLYVGASTSRGIVEMFVSWRDASHAPKPTKSKWETGPDGTEVVVRSGAIYDAIQVGEVLSCGLTQAWGELMDRVDLKAWCEQTGARASLIRGCEDITKLIIDLRDGGLRRSRSSRQAPTAKPVLKGGEVLERQEDGGLLKGGFYYATYSSTARLLDAAKKIHFDVQPLDFRSDAGGTTVTWGQDLSKTAPEDVIPSDIILESASQESGAVVLVRKKREAYARLVRTLDDLYDDTGSSTFSMDLKVREYKRRPKGEQIPTRRFVALEEPVRPVAPEPEYKSVWSAFLGWKCLIFPGYGKIVMDLEGGASEDAPCSIVEWADQRPSQRLSVVVKVNGVDHLLLAWEEPQYSLSQVEDWFKTSVSGAHRPPRWWDDVINEVGERFDSVEQLFATRFAHVAA